MADVSHRQALKLLAERLKPELASMLDEQEAAVQREHPGLTARIDPLLVRHAIDATNRRFIAVFEGAQDLAAGRDAHVEFGAVCARAGVPLDEVTAGYRLGARIGWRRTAVAIEALDLPTRVVVRLAEGWLAYAEELAADSLEGYEREAAVARGVRARARQELLEALLAGRDHREAAEHAAWPVPDALVAGVPLTTTPLDGLVDGLLGTVDGATVVLVRPGAARDAPLAYGPPVPAAQAAVSLARARRLAGLAATGHLPADGPLHWHDHLPALVVHADPAAGEALAAAALAPLADASAAREELLRETLQAWLDHPGQPLAIARRLHLHPQTVRYRLARLRERLGDALDDPEQRFALGLALRFTPSSRAGGGAG